MEDLTVLLVAMVSFSLFFSSVAVSYTMKEARDRGERLATEAENLLEAVMTDSRWTADRGLFLAAELAEISAHDVASLAGSQKSLVVIWDLDTHETWSFGETSDGDRRTAITSANVVGVRVDPARVVVTVWER